MSEELLVAASADKREKYALLLPQLSALLAGESDPIANLANVAAALRATFAWWWVGFYRVQGGELVLGPFQGPLACTRIAFGKGVCGSAWQQRRSLLVPDVNEFPGHIACSSRSLAEIVVPIFGSDGQVVGVLDVDSERDDVLDAIDVVHLEQLCALLRL